MPPNKFAFPGDDVLRRMKPEQLDNLTTHALGMSTDEGGENETPVGLIRPHHAETLSQNVNRVIIGLRAHLNDVER